MGQAKFIGGEKKREKFEREKFGGISYRINFISHNIRYVLPSSGVRRIFTQGVTSKQDPLFLGRNTDDFCRKFLPTNFNLQIFYKLTSNDFDM